MQELIHDLRKAGSDIRQVFVECPRAQRATTSRSKTPMLNSLSHEAGRASDCMACRRSVCAEEPSAAALSSNSMRRHLWRLLLPTLLGCGAIFGATPPAASSDVPNFMGDRNTAWLPDRPTGDDFLPPPNGPGPVMSSKDRPYVPNGTGQRPTYRIADLTDPILKPWVIERMKKANEDVLAGKVPYRARALLAGGRARLRGVYARAAHSSPR